jgi:hypothetical protein
MQITHNGDGTADDYFTGRRFSDNLTIKIEADGDVLSRRERLCGLVVQRSVLHIGCCDHTPLLKNRLDNGLWLHASLSAVASRCLGIDIDAEAIEHVKRATGFTNVMAGDVSQPGIAEIATPWDIALFGDVVEHVAAPTDFLAAFRKHYGARVGKIIVSVPNNMRGGNATGALRGQETINSDHRAEFSPFTLVKMVTLAGYRVDEFYYCRFSDDEGMSKTMIYQRWPYLAHTLVVVAHPVDPS